MDYAREHIRRYWSMAYRKALGTSMIVFSVALSIGMAFTSMLNGMQITNYVGYVAFWGGLIVVTALVLMSNFFDAHVSCVRYMNEEEHSRHSRNMGIWVAALAAGAVLFALPMAYFSGSYQALMMLFSFGGAFWIMYFSVALLFKHRYHEIAMGGAAMWLVFLTSAVSMANSQLPPDTLRGFTLFVSTMTIVIVSGATGFSLISNLSNEYMEGFRELTGNAKRTGRRGGAALPVRR